MNRWRGHHERFMEDRGGTKSGKNLLGGHFGQRIFDHGDIRYVILSRLSDKPSYGYELIKEIEERLSGTYSPSPGLIYPTLTMLVELGYVKAEGSEGGKKLYSTTPLGNEFLEANKPVVDAILGRMAHAASLHRRVKSPLIIRAIQNLKLAIKLKSSVKELTDEQISRMAEALDEAARKIEQC